MTHAQTLQIDTPIPGGSHVVPPRPRPSGMPVAPLQGHQSSREVPAPHIRVANANFRSIRHESLIEQTTKRLRERRHPVSHCTEIVKDGQWMVEEGRVPGVEALPYDPQITEHTLSYLVGKVVLAMLVGMEIPPSVNVGLHGRTYVGYGEVDTIGRFEYEVCQSEPNNRERCRQLY